MERIKDIDKTLDTILRNKQSVSVKKKQIISLFEGNCDFYKEMGFHTRGCCDETRKAEDLWKE